MIIYRRKDNDVVIPCGLGPVFCPDTSHNLQMKTVDSSTVLQQVEPDSGYYGLYRVIINPLTDDNLLPGNIRAGVTILGVLGTYSGELINLQAKTVDPTLQGLVVSADIGYDGLSSVTVNPVTADIDPDIQAGNIKRGVEILGVTGTFDGGPLQSKSVNSSTGSQSVTPDPSYYGLSEVTVSPYTVEGKSQTITQNGTYTFAPTSADALSDVNISVQVAGTPATVQAKSVSYNVNGEYTVTPDQGYDGLSSVDISVNVPAAQPTLQAKTVNSSTANQTVTPDQGYDGLSEVDINALTDPNLVSNNIKKDVTIFGITGSFNGDPQLQQKTVNSSTASQTVQSDGGYDGLSEVIVNPYTVESDSSTLTQNGTYSFSPVNADALSGVTVNVSVDGQVINNQNKTVNSSTSSQNITADQGYTGLGTVTVNPYTLDTKTVNPSTNSITVNSSADGMSSVTVNAVTASIDPDIQAGNIKNGITILGVTGTYDGSGGGGGDSSLYAIMHSLRVTLNDDNESTSTYVETGASLIEEPTSFEMVFKAPESEDGNKHWIFGCEHAPLRSPVQLPFFGAYVMDDTLYISAGQTQDNCVALDNGTYHFSDGIYIVGEVVEDPEDAENTVWQIKINNNEDDLYYLPYETLSSYNPICIFAKDDGNGNFSEFAESRTEFMYAMICNDDEELDFYAAGEIEKDNDDNLITSIAHTPYIMFYTYDWVNDSHTVDLIAPEIGEYDRVRAYNITADYNAYYTPEAGIRMMPFTEGMPAFAEVQEINNQNKTVDSSTSSQSITADNGYSGLGTVTVNPYTVSGVNVRSTTNGGQPQVVTPMDTDAFSFVTVYPLEFQSKTVNPSTNSITVNYDQGVYDGLSSVTVNAVTASIDPDIQAGNIKKDVEILGVVGTYEGTVIDNQNKTVDPSTSGQTITADPGYTGLGTVTVNPVNAVFGTYTITQNGPYGFDGRDFGGDYINFLQIDVSVGSSGGDWYTEWKLGNKHDLSDVDLSQVMTTYRGLYYMFSDNANPSPRYMSAPPVLGGSTVGKSGMSNAFSGVIFTNQNGTEISFPNLVTASGMYYALSYTDGITKISFPELTSINGQQAMQGFFSEQTAGTLTEIYMPKMQNVSGQNAVSSWVDDYVTGMASRKLTVHVDALRYGSDDNVAYWMGNSLTQLVVMGTASYDIQLHRNPNLSAASVLNVLNSMGSGVHTCTFYTSGLTVTDDAQGSIQTAYNTAVNNGWTINNLTITPYSA